VAIIQEGGRWRSIRTPDERRESARTLVEKLNPQERAALQKILADYEATGKSPIVEQVAQVEWDEQPMPVSEWLLNEDMVGETGKDMYPQLRADMCELFEGDYSEAVLCLHPGTRIPLLDGSTPTIKELADRWAADQSPFWVYGVESGRIVPALAQEPRETGIDDYYRVTLDDGTSFTGNARHQMVMRDGSKRRITDMTVGDSLMPFTVRLSGESARRGLRGYEQLLDVDTGKWLYTHRVVADDQCPPPCESARTVHHANFKKLDNRPSNLRRMRFEDHSRMHGDHIRQLNLAGQAVKAGRLAWTNRSPAAKAAFSAMMSARNKSMGDRRPDVTLESIKQSGAKSVREAAGLLGSSPTRVRRVFAQHGLSGTEFFGERRGKRRGAVDVTLAAIQAAVAAGSNTPDAVAARLRCAKSTIYRVLKKNSRSWSDLCEVVGNHYVVGIEHVGAGPVFCMTVPRTTNFAISTFDGKEVKTTSQRSGVFSSNTGSIGWG